MASYDAVIKLVVQGEDALKRIQDRVDKLYKTIDDLEKKKKYAGSEAAAAFVREQAEGLERVLATSKQIIKQDEQRIIKQSKLNSAVDLYERRLKQTVNSGAAGLKKFEGQIKEIETAFKFFKDRGNVTAIQALATELGRMVEYSNNVSRNERARAANQSKVFEYVKQINAYEAQGLNVAEARKKLSEFTAVAGTNQLNEAKKYADAVERQLRLLREQIALQKQVAAETNILQNALAKLENTQRELENSKLDQKALQIQAALDRQAAAAAESAAQLTKLNERQAEFLSRTDAAAAAAKRQTAEFIRQQRIAKEVAALNAAAPAPQLLLPAAAPGAPAMSGGARPRISGPIEVAGRLPGARFAGRTEDEAAMALRFAQALKEQIRPLSQIQSLYAGIAQQAAQMQRIKALPDTAMLNATGRGLQQLETAQDSYNRELQESAERLLQIDRLEASRQRRAKKLQDIADYYGSPSAMANAGFGIQGPAVPPRGTRRGGTATGGGGRTQAQMFENLALGAGFPLLFGGGPGQVLGGLLGSFVGTGFGGQILGSALGGQLEQLGVAATKAGAALQKPIDNFSTIEERAILASSSQERYVKNLIEAGQYIEATAAVQKRYNEIVGKQGSQDLVRLAKVSDELSRAWGELGVQIQAAIAGPLAGLLAWVTSLLNATNAVRRGNAMQSELTPQQSAEIQARRDALTRGRQRGTLFGGLTPQQAIKEEADIAKRIEELAKQNREQQKQAEGYKAIETQILASVERRKEIQSQINRLRESEISAGQKQLQNELTLLNTQKQFAVSLNQESAIINQIANKKVAAANAEYALTQRQQQALIINAQLELNVAEAKAKAAAEEMRQLDAANKLTPLRQAELQAVMENVVVARNNLEITKGIADNVTRSAAAQAQQTAQLAELERRQAQVNAYAEEYARTTAETTRQLEIQVNAVNNRAQATAALSQAVQTINNIEIDSLTTELQRTTNIKDREKIINRIYLLEIENAKVTLQATRAQIQAEVERQRIAMVMARVKFQELLAVARLADAQGILNRAHIDALKAQRDATIIAENNFDTAVEIANYQWKAADAVFKAAVDAAKLKKEMGGVAAAAGQFAGSMERAAGAMGGMTGAPFAAMGGAENIQDPGLKAQAQKIWQEAERFAATKGIASIQADILQRARDAIAQIALRDYVLRNQPTGGIFNPSTTVAAAAKAAVNAPTVTAPAQAPSPTPIPTTAPVAMGLSRQPGGGPGMAIVDSFPKVPTTINLQTGPVLQQEDGKKYVTLSDLEKILQDFAAVVFNNARTAGGRQYQGVN
ncbi:hypothetical protein EBT31_00685 [bacterium]|nr:hypothetical protein [bacterium]